MAQTPDPRSLRGMAQDLITRKNAGMPASDDEPIQERQVIEWLRDAAAYLIGDAAAQAEQKQLPLAGQWYIPFSVPLKYFPGGSDPEVRTFRSTIPATPMVLNGEDLVKSLAVGMEDNELSFGNPVELCNVATNLLKTAMGWGRVPVPKAAGLLRGSTVTIALPSFMWELTTLTGEYVDSDPLRTWPVDEPTRLPGAWLDGMMQYVAKYAMAMTLSGFADVLNDDAPAAAARSAQ